jgi:hypothetical protein
MSFRQLCSAALLLTLGLSSMAVVALGEQEYIVEKEFDTFEPIYLAGHEGDPQWIEGFRFSGQIYLNGGVIGGVTGEARVWNPPINFGEVYEQVSLQITNTITGLGTFQVYAQGVTLGSSTTASVGDYVLAWSGIVTNGTGSFAGFYGTSAGSGLANVFGGTASATEIITLRASF